MYNNPLHRHHDKVKVVVDQTTNKVSDKIYNKGTPELDKVMKDRGDAADIRRHKKSIKIMMMVLSEKLKKLKLVRSERNLFHRHHQVLVNLKPVRLKRQTRHLILVILISSMHVVTKYLTHLADHQDLPGGGQFDADDYHPPVPTLKLPQKRVKGKVAESTEVSETGNSDNAD